MIRMAQGTTTNTMLAHQPGVETSKAVVMEVCSSSASGTAARAVLRKELVGAGRPPKTKDGAQKVTKASAKRRVGSSTSLEAIGPTWAEQLSNLGSFCADLLGQLLLTNNEALPRIPTSTNPGMARSNEPHSTI